MNQNSNENGNTFSSHAETSYIVNIVHILWKDSGLNEASQYLLALKANHQWNARKFVRKQKAVSLSTACVFNGAY